jgi:hypothetical protein
VEEPQKRKKTAGKKAYANNYKWKGEPVEE